MKNHFRPFWLLLFLLNYSEAWPDLRSDEDYQTKTSLNQPVQEPDEEPSSHEIDQTLQHLARAGNMRNSAGWLRRPRPAVRMGEEEPEGEEQQEQKEVPEDGVANGRLKKKNGRKEERGEGSREKAEEEDVAEEVEDNDEGDLEQQKDYDYGEMPAKSEEDRGEDPLDSSRGDKGGRHGGDAPPSFEETEQGQHDSKAHNAEEESRKEANNDRHSAEDTAKPPREGEEEEGGSETRTPGAEESSAEKVPDGGEGNPEQPAEQGEPKSGNGESRNNGNEGNPIGQFGPIPGQVSPNGDAGPFIPYDPGSPIGPNGQIVPNGFGPYPNQQSGPNGQQQIGPRPYNPNGPNGPNGGAGIPSGPFNPNGQNIGIPPDSNPNGPFPPSGQPGPTGQEAINKGENTDNQVNHGNEIGEKGVGEAQGTTNGYGESEQSDQIRGGQDVTAPSVTASSTVSSSPDLTTPSPIIAPPTASPTGVGGNGTLLSPNCANNPGQWSEWRETGACTAECGACGLMQRTRDCLSFQEGRGCPCLGEYKITEACNIGVCQYPQPSCCMPYNLIYLEGKFACGPQQDELLKRFLEESNGNKAAERPKLKDRVSRNLFFRRKK